MGFKKVLRFFAILLIFLSFLINPTASFAQENVATSSATTVNDFNSGVLTNTTVIDAGSGDGSVTNTLGPETVGESQTTGTVVQNFDNANWLAQTFTATSSGLLSKVTLSLDRNNAVNADGNASLEVRNTIGGIPGTTVAGSSSILASALAQTGQESEDFIFGSLPVVESGTRYALVLYRSGSGTITADYNWYRGNAGSGNDQYPNGSRFTSSDSGATWTEKTVANPGTGDLRFTAFIRSYSTSGTQASDVLNTNSIGTEFSELSWNEALATGTDIIFEARASKSTFSKTDTSPGWISLGNSNSPVNLQSSFPGNYQHFQWRATLSGSATSTPTLHAVRTTYNLPASISSISSTTPSPTSAVVSWATSYATSSRVVYDTVSHPSPGELPNYGYAFSTKVDNTAVVNRQITIDGLRDGTIYYFRVISEGSPVAVGEESNFKTLTYAGPPIGGTAPPAESGIVAGTSTARPRVSVVAQVTKVTLPVEEQVEKEEPPQVFGEKEEIMPSPTPLTFLLEAIGTFLAGILGFFTRLLGK